MWLLKATDLNRGRCIRIGDSLPRIEKLIKKFYDGIYRGFKRCEKDEIKENIDEEDKSIEIVRKKSAKNNKSNINPYD